MTSSINERPKVSIGVIVRKNGRVLMGKRIGAHGALTWCFPGGHMEFGETPEQTAYRETYEEYGIKIKNAKALLFTNDYFKKEKKHYITIYVVCDYESGTPSIREPEKMASFGWFSWNNLPRPLFLPVKNLLKQDYHPFV